MAAIDDYQSLDLTMRFNEVGSWRLTLPTRSRAAQALALGGGLVVVRDNVFLFSGDVRTLDRSWTSDRDVLTADGPDDLTLLADEVASPVPTAPVPPYNAQTHDLQTHVPAETAIKHYVDVNIGPGAVPLRQRQGLHVATNQGLGQLVDASARWQSLLELVQPLALRGGLGLRLVQADVGPAYTREFSTYVPQYRPGTIFSADLGTLSNYRFTLRASEANYFIGGGQGEGTARNVRELGDVAAMAQSVRIAQFLDLRNTASNAEIDQTLADHIAQKAQKTEMRLTPLDVPGVRFMEDYQLGDRVRLIIDGMVMEDAVRTVTIALTTEVGETVTPFVGSPTLADVFVQRLFSELKTVGARTRNLERR